MDEGEDVVKHQMRERYSILVLIVVAFLASLQALSQTRKFSSPSQKPLMKLSELHLKLSPRVEEEWVEWAPVSRAPASVIEKSDSSRAYKKRGKALSMQLPLSHDSSHRPSLAPASIQEGRDLSPSFKSNPYYIPASAQLFGF